MTRRMFAASLLFGVFTVACAKQPKVATLAATPTTAPSATPVVATAPKCDSSVNRYRACLPDGTEVKLGAPIVPILSEFRCYGAVPQACAYPKTNQELTVFQDKTGTIVAIVGAGEGAHADYGFYGDLQLGMPMELERQHTGAQVTTSYRSTDGEAAIADKLSGGNDVVFYVANGCAKEKLYGIGQAQGAEGIKDVEGALSGGSAGCGQQ